MCGTPTIARPPGRSTRWSSCRACAVFVDVLDGPHGVDHVEGLGGERQLADVGPQQGRSVPVHRPFHLGVLARPEGHYPREVEAHDLRALRAHPVQDPGVERFVPEIELEHPLAAQVPHRALDQGHLAPAVVLGARRGVEVAHRGGDPVPGLPLLLAQTRVRLIRLRSSLLRLPNPFDRPGQPLRQGRGPELQIPGRLPAVKAPFAQQRPDGGSVAASSVVFHATGPPPRPRPAPARAGIRRARTGRGSRARRAPARRIPAARPPRRRAGTPPPRLRASRRPAGRWTTSST